MQRQSNSQGPSVLSSLWWGLGFCSTQDLQEQELETPAMPEHSLVNQDLKALLRSRVKDVCVFISNAIPGFRGVYRCTEMTAPLYSCKLGHTRKSAFLQQL